MAGLTQSEIQAVMGLPAHNSLREHLLRHENDIAADINDFGDMAVVFRVVIGRSPKEA